MNSTQVFWYLARSSGFLAFLFAWGSVTFGLLMTTRVAERIERAVQYILHRLLGLGSVVFLGVHLFTLFLDPWANFSIADLFIPFHTAYRPFWTGCGILAAYLLLTIAVTSIFQQRLPKAVWRGIHYLSFLTFFVGLVHGLGAGSDSGQLWARGIYAIAALVVVALCLRRVLWEPKPTKRADRSAPPRRVEPRAHALNGMSGGAAARQAAATPHLHMARAEPTGRAGSEG